MNLFLALERVEAETNRFGIPLSEATDPANQTRYEVDKFPTVDWSERALAATQRGYYKAETPDSPIDKSGHLWSKPRLKPE